jgi:hypothetical protein
MKSAKRTNFTLSFGSKFVIGTGQFVETAQFLELGRSLVRLR